MDNNFNENTFTKIEDRSKISSELRRYLAIFCLISAAFGFGGGYLAFRYFPDAAGGVIEKSSIVVEESDIIDIIKKASPAVVSIVASKDLNQLPDYGNNPFSDGFFFPFFGAPRQRTEEPNIQQVGAGSGFFISGDGLVMTNKHVVSDQQASYTVLTQDGKSYDAKVLAVDPRNDLAILKVEISNVHFLELTDSSQIQIGQKVIAIGNSLGQYQNTVTTGVVSGIGRSITAGSSDGVEQLEGVIQTDAAINPGNSGGPLLNVAGLVIGINTAIDREGQLVGFAIPSNDAKMAWESYKKNGRITRPVIGVRYTMVTEQLAKEQGLQRDYGALLVRGKNASEPAVIAGGPADKAGLKESDIILEVDSKKLGQNLTLASAIRNKMPGDSVRFKVFSGGAEKELNLTLEEAK